MGLDALSGPDRNLVLSPPGKRRVSIIKSWRQEGHLANGKKQKLPHIQMLF